MMIRMRNLVWGDVGTVCDAHSRLEFFQLGYGGDVVPAYANIQLGKTQTFRMLYACSHAYVVIKDASHRARLESTKQLLSTVQASADFQ